VSRECAADDRLLFAGRLAKAGTERVEDVTLRGTFEFPSQAIARQLKLNGSN
jgi:hypothetical protein